MIVTSFVVEEACWPSWVRGGLPKQYAAGGCLELTDGSSAGDADSCLLTCCLQAERARAGAAERSEAQARAKAEKASARVKQVSNAAGSTDESFAHRAAAMMRFKHGCCAWVPASALLQKGTCLWWPA